MFIFTQQTDLAMCGSPSPSNVFLNKVRWFVGKRQDYFFLDKWVIALGIHFPKKAIKFKHPVKVHQCQFRQMTTWRSHKKLSWGLPRTAAFQLLHVCVPSGEVFRMLLNSLLKIQHYPGWILKKQGNNLLCKIWICFILQILNLTKLLIQVTLSIQNDLLNQHT